MKIRLIITFIFAFSHTYINAHEVILEQTISLKSPGNPANTYILKEDGSGALRTSENIPVEISQKRTDNGSTTKIEVTIKAKEKIYFNFEEIFKIASFTHNDCLFFMPGLWYHKNLRSPKEAPSFATSDSWQVREDRLSTPLTGIFNEKTGDYYTVIRLDKFENESLSTHNTGEIILTNKTSI